MLAIWELLEGREYYIQLDHIAKLVDADCDPRKIEFKILNIVRHTKKQYQSNPAKAYEEGLVPARILCPPEGLSSEEKEFDRVYDWCKSVCDELTQSSDDDTRAENFKRNLEMYIITKLCPRLVNYDVHCYFMPRSTPLDRAIQVFIDTNQGTRPVTEFDIVAAQVDREFDLDVRDCIEKFCAHGHSRHAHYYFNKGKDKRVVGIGNWLLKISCLHYTDGGVMPQRSKYLTAFRNFLNPPNDNKIKPEADKGASRGTSENDALKATQRLNELLSDLDKALGFVADRGILTQKGLINEPAIYVIAALQQARTKYITKKDTSGASFADDLMSVYFWRTLLTDRYLGQANEELFADFIEIKKCLEKLKSDKPATRQKNPCTSNCLFLNNQKYSIPTEEDLADLKNPWPWPRINKGRKGRALAAVLLHAGPKDWGTGKKFDRDKIREYEGTNGEYALHRHHVFPKEFLNSGHDSVGEATAVPVDHGLNCAFLTDATNQKIGGDDPATYIKNWVGVSRGALKMRITSHCINYESLKKRQAMPIWYERFIEARAKILANRIKKLTELQ